jgi:undecaprenyl-phosphate 4-deoxy-4-formamido-L-arabinose transferase
MSMLYARSMQPWSVILMCVMRSRTRFIAFEAACRHHESLRAYSIDIVRAIAASREVSTFIPALAYTFAHSPTEVEVEHAERAAGESKYSLYKLIRLNFDLITGFSLVPLQLFSMFGMVVSAGAVLVYLIVIVNRLLLAGWREGFATLWDRDILAFFLVGMLLFGLGLVGEYVGRIYQQVRERPRYTIQAVLERESGSPRAP